ncbi:MAG: four helix bundle protein [Verrucomicrobiaceae bacterium]|nr:four helix bundle protein [Verrucomicrobiaceae bacterium]
MKSDDDNKSSQRKAEELEDRMIDFALRVGAVAEALPASKLGKHIASQIIRCGTSPAPNYGEADAGESTNDFIHKLGVVFKELRETRIWLKMIVRGKILPDRRMLPVLDECNQLCHIIAASIKTAKTNRGDFR